MGAVRSIILATCGVAAAIAWAPAAAIAASHTVDCTNNESIQAAVDAAAPGDVIKVLPGDCVEPGPGPAAVRITKRLKLIAKSDIEDGIRVRILPGPGQTDGIVVEPENPGDPDINGILIKGFTVEGFQNNGIWLKHTQNFKIKNNESINNLENGIWPTLSAKGLVKNNVAYGSLDSALWIEASEKVRVIKNELHTSPTGLEITVSKKIFAKGNDVHDNSVGIGLYHPSAAGLDPLGDDGDWDIIGNHVHDNNLTNPVMGGLVGELPNGVGILVLGVDRVKLQRNRVENNDFLGIATADWCLVLIGTSFDCSISPPDVEPSPDDNEYVDNTATGNGGAPPPGPFAGLAADIVLIGGTNNCYSGNTAGLTIPSPLPEC